MLQLFLLIVLINYIYIFKMYVQLFNEDSGIGLNTYIVLISLG